jgi:hypothetical protein
MLPSWIGGVDAASADGVVDRQKSDSSYQPPRLAKPRHPSYPGGELRIEMNELAIYRR